MLNDVFAAGLVAFTFVLLPWILWISVLSQEARKANSRDDFACESVSDTSTQRRQA